MNQDYSAHTTSRHSIPKRILPFLLLIVMLGLILPACGDDDTAVARDEDVPLDVTPNALADVPEGVEEATLTVENGQLKETELVLQEDQPTRLSIQNDDDADYVFEIVPSLVDKSDVPANVTTIVAFTNPDAQTYHARLLAGDGVTLKDELTVVVQTPGDAAD